MTNVLYFIYTSFVCLYVCFWCSSPPVGHGLLIHEVSGSHITTHHSRQDSSGRVISPSQGPDNTHNTQNRQTSVPPVGFEPTISAGERPQTNALHLAATETGLQSRVFVLNISPQTVYSSIRYHKTSPNQLLSAVFVINRRLCSHDHQQRQQEPHFNLLGRNYFFNFSTPCI